MILVTGATGNVGRELVSLLLAAGEQVAAVTRRPATAALPAGARVVAGDASRPETLAAALDGISAVLLVPRAAGGAAGELLSLAAARGAQRVVLISAVTVQYPAGLPRFAAGFRAAEDAARASGLPWVILRCADFASNALAWAPQIRAYGKVRGAYGNAVTSVVDERDVAAVAAVVLVEPGHAGQAHVLTGPQPLTPRDKVRLIGEAIGTGLSFEEVPPGAVRQGMLAQGLPPEVPDRLLGSLADYAKRPGPSSATVARILGRPARTFGQWASDHAADFRN